MKKTKLLTSIVLTTILTTSFVLAWVDLGTVNSGNPLTATAWNNMVTRINEIASKVTSNSTPPVFSASLTNNQSPTVETVLTNWTENVDNKNAFNNGVYTIPKSGYYRIVYSGLFHHGGNSTYYGYLGLFSNDVLVARAHSSHSSINNSIEYDALTPMNKIFYLNIGDTLKLKGYVANSAAYIFSGFHSNYTIEYIGE